MHTARLRPARSELVSRAAVWDELERRRVPRAVRVASAPRYRAPTAVLEPDSMVSHAYRQLADHLLQELGV